MCEGGAVRMIPIPSWLPRAIPDTVKSRNITSLCVIWGGKGER